MAKRPNPADLTRRNLTAAKKRTRTLQQAIRDLKQRVAKLEARRPLAR